jgi:hypothetical protein
MLAGGAVAAQTPGIAVQPGEAQPAHGQNLDLSVNSLPTAQGGIYDLNMATTQSGPPGTIAVTSKAPPLAYSFDQFVRNIHGYASAGVSSGGGHEFSGGLFIPLVPDRADLAVGVTSGQVGDLPPVVRGGKRQTANYNAYYADLHLHPADNVDAYIGVSGLRLKSPYDYGYGLPLGAP